jgi:predicted GIY-YIG superfamily endonuclease
MVESAKSRKPFKVVYSEKFKTRTEARLHEKFFKTGAGREFRNGILNKYIPE